MITVGKRLYRALVINDYKLYKEMEAVEESWIKTVRYLTRDTVQIPILNHNIG